MELPESDSYLDEVCELLSRRFGYPLVPSRKDLEEIRFWRKRGVHVAAVERGIEEALASHSRSSRPPLVYSRRAVFRHARKMGTESSRFESESSARRHEPGGGAASTEAKDDWPQRGLWRELEPDERRRIVRRVRAKLAAQRSLMSRKAYTRSYMALLNRLLEKNGT